jgi:heme/copper-type cytochrome/quinol oxidase subunit 1
MGMPLWTLIVQMDACAAVLVDGLATTAPNRRPCPVRLVHIAPEMAQQLIWTQRTAVYALASMISVGTIVPFHQLVTAKTIAMGMPLWTKIVQMDACASVLVDGLATTAPNRRRCPVMLVQIAPHMEQQPIRMQRTAVYALVSMISVGTIVPFHPLATARTIAMGMPLWT